MKPVLENRLNVGDTLDIGESVIRVVCDNIKGTITAGKLADFVVLEKDPHDVPPDTIKDIKVVRTVAGGRTTHQA